MIQRHTRHPELFDLEETLLLAALKQCRSVIIESHRQRHPRGRT
jgi:hypothetical protein